MLLTAPIELAGDWGDMSHGAVVQVIERARRSCLDGTRLVSDHQPTTLRVDEHNSGPPAVWLHPDGSSIAWIMVDIGQTNAKPANPCQWIEEALVEAFSLRGLGRLAEGWKQTPPSADDGGFGDAIAEYRQGIVQRYPGLAEEPGGIRAFSRWFAAYRIQLESAGSLNSFTQAASLAMLAEYEAAPECIESLGTLNRWPARSGVPLEEYLRLWEVSCGELQASSRLPTRLREMIRLT